MQLLYPIGLLAFTGLIIPVLVHLWSIKPGKTLKIGSIAFLGENSTSSSNSFKITDLLLFVLRCLILILIAFMLAQPYFKKTTPSTKNKGWILMDQNQLVEIYKGHKNTIDSLIRIGFELHNFNFGFAKFTLNDSISGIKFSSELKYNTLLNQLNRDLPHGYAAYVFADRRLTNFDGNLPQLHFKLVWKEVINRDTVKTWPSTFLGKLYRAKSTPGFTIYNAKQPQNLPKVKVMIYDPTGIDSRYIKAGLNAIADFTKRKIEITKLPGEADVVFWLSDQAIILKKSKSNARLFSYRKGKVQKVNSTLQIKGDADHAIALKNRIVFDNLKGTIIWVDGYGVPLLIKEAKRNHFHFYSRFNPQWSDLVWDEQFVKELLPIVLGKPNDVDFGFEDSNADQRVIAKTQFSEAKNSTPRPSIEIRTQKIDDVMWMLAFLVLIIERVLSFRNKNINYAKS
ncbi:BatA domain-containing protein [Pedobacter sp. Du54]|uniref:BatA domain-containing protein n=1 Tax=Pedobacter anseongensis TaxID=3133439 RepID=UPI0030A2DCE1